MFKKWKQQIYTEAFDKGRSKGLSEGFHDGIEAGYHRGFVDGSKGGITINEYGMFICKDAEHYETIISAKCNNKISK